jgi:hypothetical protein
MIVPASQQLARRWAQRLTRSAKRWWWCPSLNRPEAAHRLDGQSDGPGSVPRVPSCDETGDAAEVAVWVVAASFVAGDDLALDLLSRLAWPDVKIADDLLVLCPPGSCSQFAAKEDLLPASATRTAAIAQPLPCICLLAALHWAAVMAGTDTQVDEHLLATGNNTRAEVVRTPVVALGATPTADDPSLVHLPQDTTAPSRGRRLQAGLRRRSRVVCTERQLPLRHGHRAVLA